MYSMHFESESDFDELGNQDDYTVVLPAGSIFYRGYGFNQIKKVARGFPRGQRPRVYGSCPMALLYRNNPEFTDPGVLFSYQTEEPLNMFLINRYTAKSLIESFLDAQDYETVCLILLAFGYHRGIFQDIISGSDAEKIDACARVMVKKPMWQKSDYPRESYYEYDLPLIRKLAKFLSKQGYQGIISYVDKTISDFAHEIIIFEPWKYLKFNGYDLINCSSLDDQTVQSIRESLDNEEYVMADEFRKRTRKPKRRPLYARK